MTMLDRKTCIKIVEHEYFGNVVAGNINKILNCFTDDVTVIIRHGDNPVRQFRINPASSDYMNLQEFYEHLCGNYIPWFGNFTHYIDIEQQRSSCTFTVKLDPRPDSSYNAAGMQVLNNCNFFTYRDGRISEMTIYYSNSNTSDKDKPTGYPQS